MAAKAVDADQTSIWAPRYLPTTLSMGSLILLPAFESLAVTTAMPAVSRDLGGEALYGLAFGMVFAAGLIGMVLARSWADRRGPRHPLFAALLVFAAGLLLAGLAQSMPMLVLARADQGIGGGALSVVI
ncbi:MAG: MFS transporter [Renibacterium salmoninarum]|nr:MFS transporter [Renibacterium salmoninarum]